MGLAYPLVPQSESCPTLKVAPTQPLDPKVGPVQPESSPGTTKMGSSQPKVGPAQPQVAQNRTYTF